jgi:hypothetical protein
LRDAAAIGSLDRKRKVSMEKIETKSTRWSLRKLSLAICGCVLAGVLAGCTGETDDAAAPPAAPPAAPAGGEGG